MFFIDFFSTLGNKLSQHIGQQTGEHLTHSLGDHSLHDVATAHIRVARGLKGPHHIFECRRTNIIGTLVQNSSPFLFPCAAFFCFFFLCE